MDNAFKSNVITALKALTNPINDNQLKEANKFVLENEKNPEYFAILVQIFEEEKVRKNIP